MNYEHLFDAQNCDLSNLLTDFQDKVYISKFIQKAFIGVNEEGTEAAIVSGF